MGCNRTSQHGLDGGQVAGHGSGGNPRLLQAGEAASQGALADLAHRFPSQRCEDGEGHGDAVAVIDEAQADPRIRLQARRRHDILREDLMAAPAGQLGPGPFLNGPVGRQEQGGKEPPRCFVALREGRRHAFAVMVGQHGDGKDHEEEDAEDLGGSSAQVAGQEGHGA